MMLTIQDHSRLQGSVARCALAGVATALSLTLLDGSFTDPLIIAADILLVGLALSPPRSLRALAVTAAIAALAGAGARLGQGRGAVLVGAVASLLYLRAVDGSRGRRLAVWAIGALSLVAGAAVVDELHANGTFAAVAPDLERALLGAALGLFAGLGAVGRELAWSVAPASAPIVSEVVGGELGALLDRAGGAYRDARGALGSDDSALAAAAADLMSKIERFVIRWRDLESETPLLLGVSPL